MIRPATAPAAERSAISISPGIWIRASPFALSPGKTARSISRLDFDSSILHEELNQHPSREAGEGDQYRAHNGIPRERCERAVADVGHFLERILQFAAMRVIAGVPDDPGRDQFDSSLSNVFSGVAQCGVLIDGVN